MKSMPTTFGMRLPWQLYCRVTQINFQPVTKCPVRFFDCFFSCARDKQALEYLGGFLRNLALRVILKAMAELW